MTAALPTEEQIKRQVLFVPLESKQALHDWVELYLGLDLPDSIVDEQSTSTPMGSLWEIYDRCRRNEEEEFSRILNYASRMSFKTLSAAVLEVLMVFHLGRSVAHMAAIEGQAKKSQEYVKKFLNRPILRDYVVGTNQRQVEVVRYRHKRTGESISPKQWGKLSTEFEKDQYEQLGYSIKIVICSMQGANSDHVPTLVIDEVDVVNNPAAYEEARAIPDAFEGKMPVTLLTSTRKFSYGLVQKEINEAHNTGLEIRHWNILDVTERCQKKRHLSDTLVPDTTIYRSDETLRSLSEQEYEDLSDKQKELYVKDVGFRGCLEKCKLFAMCRGRLATHQISASNLLKKIPQVQEQFRSFSPQMAKAQLLCWKPSTEGLIYPRLDRSVHLKSAAQIAQMVTGDDYTSPAAGARKKMTKGELLALMQTREVRWFAGMDFGFTHNFAVVQGFRDGNRMYIFDVVAQPELDLGQMIQVCDERLKPYDPIVYADPEDPGRIKTLKKAGFRMREAPKPKGSVVGGIEIVRLKMWPAVGQPELFFLAEDEGVELLFQRLQEYHWETDAAGRVSNIPDETNDDECDALRYLVMNVFAPKGKITLPREGERDAVAAAVQQPRVEEQLLAAARWQQIQDYVGVGVPKSPWEDKDDADSGAPTKGSKGSFRWDIG